MKHNDCMRLVPLLLLLLLLCGCTAKPSAYEKNDALGYTISVKFDANGGMFTTNTAVIVDSYAPASLARNDSGQLQLALLAPDDPQRGNDAFAPTKSGYFLAGWYASCDTVAQADGQTACTYADRWDFASDILTLDAEASYSAAEPVLTLYAAWVPLFRVEFYERGSGTKLGSFSFDPTVPEPLKLPAWNETTGCIDMYRFPKQEGSTFRCAYWDEQGTKPISDAQILHGGTVDLTDATAIDPILKLYLDYDEGEWYHIYSASQLAANASLNGCYELYADLDFSDEIWPTAFVYGNFSGTILGNGHTISNVQIVQTNNSKSNAGLFGCLTEQAQLSELTFDTVDFTIHAGTRVAGAGFGLLTGTLSGGASVSELSIRNGTLWIDSDCYFGTSDYVIGLICGMGDATCVAQEHIECRPAGNAPENVYISVEDGQVTVEIVTP